MWDLPRPGLVPLSPALAGRSSTTVPPGKPLHHFEVYSSVALSVLTLLGNHHRHPSPKLFHLPQLKLCPYETLAHHFHLPQPLETTVLLSVSMNWLVETSLAVQWLRLCASTAAGTGSTPGQGTKIPPAAQCGQNNNNNNVVCQLYLIKKKNLKIKESLFTFTLGFISILII